MFFLGGIQRLAVTSLRPDLAKDCKVTTDRRYVMMIRSWFWRQWPLPTPSWGTIWKKHAKPVIFRTRKNGDFAEAHVLSCKTITICLQQFHERILFLNHTTLVLPQMTAQSWHHLPMGSCQLGSRSTAKLSLSDKTVDNTLNSYKVHIPTD